MQLEQFLTRHHIPFEPLHHREVFTANRVAEELHVPGKEVAKSVLLRAGDGYALCVLPATCRVDLEKIRRRLNEPRVEMASETEIEQLFPDCERGAMPPFGSLYQMRTLVDESLAEDERIVFDANSHTDAIRMAYRDYEALEHPLTGRFACQG